MVVGASLARPEALGGLWISSGAGVAEGAHEDHEGETIGRGA